MMIRLVFSDVNAPVEKVEITTAQASAGHHCLSQRTLLQPVVRRFAGDDHVVDVAFAQACLGDADELSPLLQFLQIRGAAISHPASQPPDELLDKARKRSFIWDLSFDSFGH